MDTGSKRRAIGILTLLGAILVVIATWTSGENHPQVKSNS